MLLMKTKCTMESCGVCLLILISQSVCASVFVCLSASQPAWLKVSPGRSRIVTGSNHLQQQNIYWEVSVMSTPQSSKDAALLDAEVIWSLFLQNSPFSGLNLIHLTNTLITQLPGLVWCFKYFYICSDYHICVFVLCYNTASLCINLR